MPPTSPVAMRSLEASHHLPQTLLDRLHTRDAQPRMEQPCRACPELVERDRLNFRPLQIRFERCRGSATVLSLQRPSPLSFRVSRSPYGTPFRHGSSHADSLASAVRF